MINSYNKFKNSLISSKSSSNLVFYDLNGLFFSRDIAKKFNISLFHIDNSIKVKSLLKAIPYKILELNFHRNLKK